MVGILIIAPLAMSAWVGFMRGRARLQGLIALDPLTSLLNRRGVLLLAQRLRQIALCRKQHMLLFFADLDHFKQINDSPGHKVGDSALQSAATLLRVC